MAKRLTEFRRAADELYRVTRESLPTRAAARRFNKAKSDIEAATTSQRFLHEVDDTVKQLADLEKQA